MVTRFPGAADSVQSLQPGGVNGQQIPQALLNALYALVAIETALLNGIDIHLPSGGVITARNAADDADLEIAAAGSFVDGGDTYDLLRLFNGKLIFDQDDYGTMAVLNTDWVFSSFATFDPATFGGSVGTRVTPRLVRIQDGSGGSVEMLNSAATSVVRAVSADASHEASFSVTDLGHIAMLKGLPTADPVNPGQLWNDMGTIKVSL